MALMLSSPVAGCVDVCGPCLDCCDCGPDAEAEAQRLTRYRRFAWALTAFTVVWNGIEAAGGLLSGLLARSVALIGFGLDSLVEVSSALVVTWWLSHRSDEDGSKERRAVRLIAVSFFGIAAYVSWQAMSELAGFAERPERSPFGMVMIGMALLVMPSLAWAKRRVARELGSVALMADAAETRLCFYLSAVVLAGLLANGVLGWWWMDPIAGLAVAAVAVNEGREAWAEGAESDPTFAPCAEACCPACPVAAA
jgi:divalent metal cation (Fe/Co/Zn/Cd) transporter